MIAEDRRDHDETTAPEPQPDFKAKVALAAIRGEKTLDGASAAVRRASEPDQAVEGSAARGGSRRIRLEAKADSGSGGRREGRCTPRSGELALENDFLAGALGKAGTAERKAMIDRSHDLPVTGRPTVLGISRGSVYYLPRPCRTPIWR